MKLAFILTFVGAAVVIGAEVVPNSDKPGTTSDIDVWSDHAVFDWQTNTATYWGNVRAVDPRMKLTCSHLAAHWLDTERVVDGVTNHVNQITTIIAEDQVEITITGQQGTTQAYGDKAVYTAATDLVELTGHPKLLTKMGPMTADRILVERASGKLRAEGSFHMHIPASSLKEPGFLPQPGQPKAPQ